jgi:hypothetical protein
LGVDFEPKRAAQQRSWERRLNELKRYKARHGHCRIPVSDEAHAQLQRWLSSYATRARRAQLDAERAKRLQEVVDLTHTRADLRWEEHFREWKALSRLAAGPTPGSRAWWWAVVQRRQRRRGKVSQERIARLDAAGFAWNPTRDSWDANVARLHVLKRRTGRGSTRLTDSAPDAKLRNWVASTAFRWRTGDLSPERVAQLRELGFAEPADLSRGPLRQIQAAPREASYSVNHAAWLLRSTEKRVRQLVRQHALRSWRSPAGPRVAAADLLALSAAGRPQPD